MSARFPTSIRTKAAALTFLAFIALLIVAADTGQMPMWVQRLHGFPNGDRVGHVVLYGILAFLLARAFPHPFRLGPFLPSVTGAALLGFSAAEELSQRFFSTRTPDPLDLTCSCLGVVVGTWAAFRWKRALERA